MNHELYGIVVRNPTKVCVRSKFFHFFWAKSFFWQAAQLSQGAARIWAGPRRAPAERGEPRSGELSNKVMSDNISLTVTRDGAPIFSWRVLMRACGVARMVR